MSSSVQTNMLIKRIPRLPESESLKHCTYSHCFIHHSDERCIYQIKGQKLHYKEALGVLSQTHVLSGNLKLQITTLRGEWFSKPGVTQRSDSLFHAEDVWKTCGALNPFNTISGCSFHELIQEKGDFCVTGSCRKDLSETYPIIFSTGRAELMFHFWKTPTSPWSTSRRMAPPWPFPCRRRRSGLDRASELNGDGRRKASHT